MGLFPEGAGHFPERVGLFPEGAGHFPERVGLFPEGAGHFPERVGLFPSPHTLSEMLSRTHTQYIYTDTSTCTLAKELSSFSNWCSVFLF